MSDRDVEEKKAEMLEGIAMQLEWQNAMLATVAYEVAQMQYVMMCAEGDTSDTPDYENMMNRAATFRDMWQSDYHPEVRYR